jgi:hypothetical protein
LAFEWNLLFILGPRTLEQNIARFRQTFSFVDWNGFNFSVSGNERQNCGLSRELIEGGEIHMVPSALADIVPTQFQIPCTHDREQAPFGAFSVPRVADAHPGERADLRLV